MPFAGFEDFEACVVAQRGKGKSDDSARRICGALQAKVEGKKSATVSDDEFLGAADHLDDEQIETITDGDLFEVMQEYAVKPPEEGEEPIIEEIFITDNDEVVSSDDVLHTMVQKSMKGFNTGKMVADIKKSAKKLELMKTAVGTTQSKAEIGQSAFTTNLAAVEVVSPPYPPELLAVFLEVDEIHWRCVRTKTTDAVGREFEIVPAVAVKPEEGDTSKENGKGTSDKEENGKSRSGENGKSFIQKIADLTGVGKSAKEDTPVPVSKVEAETTIVEDFIEDANDVIEFEGVLERAAMDYEAIGWAAIEVIRSADRKIVRLAHIPAVRVRVLKGWKGFVELIESEYGGSAGSDSGGQLMYYQPFGDKVKSTEENPLTNKPDNYDPKKHGPLTPENTEWNLIDRKTGQPTLDLTKAANEIIWIPRHHTNTIYYGYTDIVPALGWLLANVSIRDFILQFFEHNTVPRYAIIIEGAKLSEPVKQTITQYFSTHVKGKAHKTLIIPIPSMRGEVKVRFERLDADSQESSFQETKKNNSQNIMTAHGVSPAIIGISDVASLGSGKGLSQAEIYKDRIVTPSQRTWERVLNHMFRIGLGVQLIALKFNPLDIRDRESEQKLLSGYLEKGCLTINEVRKKAGLGPPIEGGDRAFILTPSGLNFVDEMTEAMGTEREGLENQIQETKDQMAMKAIEDKAKMTAERQIPKVGGGVGGQAVKQFGGGAKPKSGASKKAGAAAGR